MNKLASKAAVESRTLDTSLFLASFYESLSDSFSEGSGTKIRFSASCDSVAQLAYSRLDIVNLTSIEKNKFFIISLYV